MKVHILYDGIIWMQGRAELRTLYIFADKAIQCEKICGICQETKDQVWRVSRAGKTNIYTFVSDRYVRGWTCLPLFFVLLKDILKIRLIET